MRTIRSRNSEYRFPAREQQLDPELLYPRGRRKTALYLLRELGEQAATAEVLETLLYRLRETDLQEAVELSGILGSLSEKSADRLRETLMQLCLDPGNSFLTVAEPSTSYQMRGPLVSPESPPPARAIDILGKLDSGTWLRLDLGVALDWIAPAASQLANWPAPEKEAVLSTAGLGIYPPSMPAAAPAAWTPARPAPKLFSPSRQEMLWEILECCLRRAPENFDQLQPLFAPECKLDVFLRVMTLLVPVDLPLAGSAFPVPQPPKPIPLIRLIGNGRELVIARLLDLTHGDTKTAATALENLGRLGEYAAGEPVASRLGELLDSAIPAETRSKAAAALVSIYGHHAPKYVKKYLEGVLIEGMEWPQEAVPVPKDSQTQSEWGPRIAEIVGATTPPPGETQPAEALRESPIPSEVPDSLRAAAEQTAQAKEVLQSNSLIAALQSPKLPGIALAALRLADTAGHPELLPALRALVLETETEAIPSGTDYWTIVHAMAAIVAENPAAPEVLATIETILSKLSQPDRAVRERALSVLGNIVPTQNSFLHIVPRIVPLVLAEDCAIRSIGLRALAHLANALPYDRELASAEILKHLPSLLLDANPEVRAAAVTLVTVLGQEAGSMEIIAALHSLIDDPKIIIEDRIHDRDSFDWGRRSALRALRAVGPPAFETTGFSILNMVMDASPETQLAAAQAAFAMGPGPRRRVLETLMAMIR